MGRTTTQQRVPPAPEIDDVVHARVLRYFTELVTRLGGDASTLALRVGIPPAELAAGQAGATYRQMVRLIELAAVELRCRDFGMRLATLQGGAPMFGPLGLAMRNSRTFGAALDYVSRHSYAHSLAARIWLRRSPTGNAVFVGHDILLGRMPDRSQAIEQILLSGHLSALELTGGAARVRKVHFRHQPVSTLRTYRRYFGCEVRFGQPADGVEFLERDLACPIVDSDLQAFREATAYIDRKFTRRRPPLHAEARGVVMRLLGSQHCTNARVATALRLHQRTLHRRLAAEGTSFQQIKDEVRRDALLYYLRQTILPLALVSERLGFAEQSIMTRTCRRWFAQTPTALRTLALRTAR